MRSKVLVAEDEPAIREFVQAALEDAYEVTAVENGTEAIQALNDRSDFDLLFIDIILMDGPNGIEVANQAKKLWPHIAVLYGTGFMESLALSSEKLHGHVLRKPYTAGQLISHVQEALAS